MTPNIPIIAWAPDADPTVPGVLSDIENMVPTQRGYAPEFELAAPDAWTATVPAECYGAAGLVFQSLLSAVFIGAGDRLYASTGSGLNDVTRASGVYPSVGQNVPWQFAAFRDVAIAVQVNNATQATANYGTTDFADLAGAPKAATIAVNKNFVLLGNVNDGAAKPDGWACSALEDYSDWTPDIATQSAAGRLTATQGPILRLIAWRDYVIAFKARGVYRGTYVGAADNTWSWPLVSAEVGLIERDAVCEAEGVLYWMGEDGFYRWAGGGIERIASAPWRWFRSVLLGSFSVARVQAVWDSVRRVVRFVAHVGRTGFAGPYCLTYHPDTDRWGRSDLYSQWAFTLPSSDVALLENSTNIATPMVPGYVHSATLEIVAHAGAASSSSFTTGDIGDDDDVVALTRARVRFLSAPTTSSATHYHRMNLGDALTTGETIARSDGKYDITHAARWHRLKFAQTGRYEVTGFRVEPPKAGKR